MTCQLCQGTGFLAGHPCWCRNGQATWRSRFKIWIGIGVFYAFEYLSGKSWARWIDRQLWKMFRAAARPILYFEIRAAIRAGDRAHVRECIQLRKDLRL